MFETILLLGSMVLLLFIRTPIAFGMIIASGITFLVINNPVFANPAYLSRLSFYSVDQYALMAVTFFLLAGDLVQFGLAERLVRWVQSMIGFMRGALGAVTILSSLLFGALSGSMMATIAAIGPVMMPEMEKSGYSKKASAALVTASGFLGILIPPSIPSLIYATIAGLSVAELFIATVIPGFIMAAGYLVLNHFLVGRYLPVPKVAKVYTPEGMKEFVSASKRAVPVLLMPLIVLGGIYGGIFTPTEAGCIAVVYGLVTGFALKMLKVNELTKLFLQSGRTTAVVLILVAFAAPLGRIFSVLKIPDKIAGLIMGITSDPYGVVLIISFVILIMGMFLDTNAIILITVPAFAPLINAVGFNPLQYAALTVVNLGIGCITPPFGFGLFMGARTSGLKVHELVPSLMPYMVWCVITLLLVLFIPQISLWLPSILLK